MAGGSQGALGVSSYSPSPGSQQTQPGRLEEEMADWECWSALPHRSCLLLKLQSARVPRASACAGAAVGSHECLKPREAGQAEPSPRQRCGHGRGSWAAAQGWPSVCPSITHPLAKGAALCKGKLRHGAGVSAGKSAPFPSLAQISFQPREQQLHPMGTRAVRITALPLPRSLAGPRSWLLGGLVLGKGRGVRLAAGVLRCTGRGGEGGAAGGSCFTRELESCESVA